MLEHHPYGTFIPPKAQAMIIGSFPIAKFSDPRRKSEIKPHEFPFFFGGEKNLLWRLLGHAFNRELKNREDIVRLLEKKGIGVGDVIKSCRRKEGGSSDSDLYDIVWNHQLLADIQKHKIKKVYFTSRKVEQWFNKLFPGEDQLERVSLISPSAQSARSIVRMASYQRWKRRNPQGKTFDFLADMYKQAFNPGQS